MSSTSDDPWLVAESARGKVIEKVWRILYSTDAGIDSDCGALQLSFTDSSYLLLDVAGDGEPMKALAAPWRDPCLGAFGAFAVWRVRGRRRQTQIDPRIHTTMLRSYILGTH